MTLTEKAPAINDQGVKWWPELRLTKYAVGKGLLDVKVWKVERPDGYKSYLLTKGKDILDDDQTIEGLGIKIDLLALLEE